MRSVVVALTCAFIGLWLNGTTAHAQATRTWVSGVGDDVNPCSRTAPCKTFAGAISKTAAGGEISVLDPGGFGAVTITKSISIVAVGQEAGILASGINGITINAGVGDFVYLQGLNIEGNATGLSGINILKAGDVRIDKCVIRGFQGAPGAGINVAATSLVAVIVTDCTISKNTTVVLVKPAAGILAEVILDRVTIDSTTTGLHSEGPQAQHPHIDATYCIGCATCTMVCPEGDVLGMVGGKAAIVVGYKCIGHSLCAEACPVGAITMVMAKPSMGADMPYLSPEFETSIENMFIVGELGGLALIKNAINQGRDCIDTIANRLTASGAAKSGPDIYDVLIVGAGPAGISASLRAIEKKLNYLTELVESQFEEEPDEPESV